MTTESKDNKRSNAYTGILEIKLILDRERVVALDIQHVHECYFIEDIYCTCMTGKITFTDNYGMYEYGPFTGNESLSIRYGRYSTREVVFRIVSVERITPRGEVSSQVSPVISIEFADTSFESFISYKFSRSYESNQSHTEVVKHILKNMVGFKDNDINIIPSISKLTENFCIPYWSPKTAINWILSAAYTNNHYGYMCYTNTENRFSVNVKPLSYLLSSNNVMDERSFTFEQSEETEDVKAIRSKILGWWIDGLNHRRTRSFRNIKWMDSDITTKKVHTVRYDFDEGMKYTPVLGNYSIFDVNYSLSKDKFTGIGLRSGMEDPLLMKKYATNMFVKQYSLEQLVNIMLLGNEKRYAGHQIFINWKSVDQESKTKNRLYDGVYLVKSITHDFINGRSPLGYVQRVVLIKNGFQTPPGKSLKKAINMNTKGGRKTSQFKES